jgi:serine/threonine-protein phosphatase PGAM5
MSNFLRALAALFTFAVILGSGIAAPEPAPPAPVTRTIYLVRHGNYSPDDKHSDGGTLTALGIAQARLVAARLRGAPVPFTSLHASTMTRADQTARIVNESLPQLTLQPEPLLRECTPPTRRADIMAKETPAELAAAEAQLDQAFGTFFAPARGSDQHDILVCHGNVIRYLVTKALGVDTKAWLGFSVAHCSLTVIQVAPDGTCKVLAVGDAGHIPQNLQSGIAKAEPQLVAPK